MFSMYQLYHVTQMLCKLQRLARSGNTVKEYTALHITQCMMNWKQSFAARRLAIMHSPDVITRHPSVSEAKQDLSMF